MAGPLRTLKVEVGEGLLGSWQQERRLLLEVTCELVKQGLVTGSAGNASLRLCRTQTEDLVLITPSRLRYSQQSPDDLVILDLEGGPVEGDRLPSTESALHLALYRARRDVGAVIHTHGPYSSAAAVAAMAIPPIIDEMVVKVGGSVNVAEYGFPSSQELALRACDAMGDRNAVLLRNHGLIGVGRDLWEALDVCQTVERAAQTFIFANLIGKAVPLPREIIELEQELFRMQRRETLNSSVSLKGDHGNNT